MSDLARRIILQDLESVQSVMLTRQQWQVVKFIEQRGATTTGDISAHFNFKGSHTAMICRALFDKGYVERTPISGHQPSGFQFQYKLATL